MKRCLAILLSALLLMTSVLPIRADMIYNDDHLNWDGMYDPDAPCTHRTRTRYGAAASTCIVPGHGAYAVCNDCDVVLEGSDEALPLLEHTYDYICDADCNVCGFIREGAEHSYRSERIAPTCTEEGKWVFTCNRCGDSHFEIIPATGHTEVTVVVKDATCTESGLTEGKKCSVCGEVLVAQEVIEALGHTELAVPGKDATCTESGLTAGVKCSVCGEVIVAQQTIHAIDHNYHAVVTAPTCVAEGYTTYTCAKCGDSYVSNTVSATNHEGTTVTVPGYAATCTENGMTESVYCTACGKVFKNSEIIPALGHTEVLVPGYAVTCTESGLSDGKKCSVCGEILVAQQTIAAVGHIYDDDHDADCNECGYLRDVVTPGDADGDGRVNNRDLGVLQKYLNEWSVSVDTRAVDLNGDGKVNNRDLGLLQRLLNQ